MAHDVFISYSVDDKAVAEAVCVTLESRNIRCWIAPRDVLPGTEWAEAVVDGIDESRVFVLVLSFTSNSSPQVIREVGRAASKGIPIVPLRIDAVTPSKAMEFFVSSHHFLDAQMPPLEKHLRQLANTVQQLLTRERVTRRFPEIAREKEKAKREAELAAKERERREAKEAEKTPVVLEKRPPKAEKVIAKRSGFWWVGIALLSAGAAFVGIMMLITPSIPSMTGEPWYPTFGGVLMFTLPFVIPGVCCLRLAIARQFRDEPATGGVPNSWWSLPIVLGFLGGAISWVKQRHVNWRTARNMLTWGILSTFLWAIPFFILVSQPPPPPALPPPAPTPPAPAPAPAPTPPPPAPPPEAPPPEAALTAADIPELADHVARGQVWGHLKWNPFEDLLVKPDGTPFRVAYTCATKEVEPMAQAVYMLEDYLPRFGLGPKGGNWTTFCPRFDLEAQISWFEDMCTTFKPDWIMCHSVSAELLAPAAEKAVYEYGIPIFTLDCGIESGAITSFIAHKFEGPGGTDILGEWLIEALEDRGYGPDNPCVVGELWGMREMLTAQLRNKGFHKAVDREPWITVIESPDTNWAEEQTATITMDMITAHPEIAAIWHHGCGAAGIVPGLEAIGRLFPIEDPDHIVIASNDVEIALWDAVIDGRADAVSTHGGVEPTDICFQVAVYHVVLGQPVEGFYQCPYIMVTRDNIDTVQIGGIPPAPGWPRGRYDVWIPMDPMEPYGFPQPSLELRMQYMGY